ncbi:MAG: phosphoribosylglycinamide formyltransferase [Polyangia bacterium]
MPSLRKPRFAILGSGRGSNAAVLLDAFLRGDFEAELAVVISNVASAPILTIAQNKGFCAASVEVSGTDRAEQEQRLLATLASHHVDHLLLAGYMRLLSPSFVQQFPGVILNIHPSLLPDFPGRTAIADQWHARVQIAGATVHFVDAGIDSGPILLSGSLCVRGDEGIEGLASRVLTEVEHVIYPRAVQLLLHRLAQGTPLHQEAARTARNEVQVSLPPSRSRSHA